jgi:tRNA(Ile)-lysidine synthase
MSPLEALPQAPVSLPWDGESAMDLPQGLGRIQPVMAKGRGIPPALLQDGRCMLRLRAGGEKLQPAGRRGHHALKKLYQEAGVPPWERERRPLLYVDGQLAQVAGLWTAQEFAAGSGEKGVMLHWSSSAIENAEQKDDN